MKFLFFTILLLIVSCTSVPDISYVDYTNNGYYQFPSSISEQCYIAKQDAKNCILKAEPDRYLSPKYQCTVKIVKGTRMIGGYWAWYEDRYLNHWVLGTCDGNNIRIASPPNDEKHVSYEVLKHEFGHHWLICSGGSFSHDSRFSSCFIYWYDTKTLSFIADSKGNIHIGRSHTKDGIEFIDINIKSKSGRMIHFDVVREK